MGVPREYSALAIVQLATNKTLLLAAAGCCIGVGAVAAIRKLARRQTPEEQERQRRLRVNGIGRFASAEIVDVLEQPLPSGEQTKVVVYQYEVGGVEYETSQDITPIAPLLANQAISPGLPASIKYDPNNPGNSIMVCETWSGVI